MIRQTYCLDVVTAPDFKILISDLAKERLPNVVLMLIRIFCILDEFYLSDLPEYIVAKSLASRFKKNKEKLPRKVSKNGC